MRKKEKSPKGGKSDQDIKPLLYYQQAEENTIARPTQLKSSSMMPLTYTSNAEIGQPKQLSHPANSPQTPLDSTSYSVPSAITPLTYTDTSIVIPARSQQSIGRNYLPSRYIDSTSTRGISRRTFLLTGAVAGLSIVSGIGIESIFRGKSNKNSQNQTDATPNPTQEGPNQSNTGETNASEVFAGQYNASLRRGDIILKPCIPALTIEKQLEIFRSPFTNPDKSLMSQKMQTFIDFCSQTDIAFDYAIAVAMTLKEVILGATQSGVYVSCYDMKTNHNPLNIKAFDPISAKKYHQIDTCLGQPSVGAWFGVYSCDEKGLEAGVLLFENWYSTKQITSFDTYAIIQHHAPTKDAFMDNDPKGFNATVRQLLKVWFKGYVLLPGGNIFAPGIIDPKTNLGNYQNDFRKVIA